MSKTLSESAAAAIRSVIDKATAEENQIPGFVTVVVGKDGKRIFSHASGTRGMGMTEPMTLDTIFYFASCTKLISLIATLQLVEQGKLALDDADQVEEICPELKTIRILDKVDESGKGYFVDKKNRITLRMLLTHTAGLGYTFFNETLCKWSMPRGLDELQGKKPAVVEQPLLHEPGTQWEYGPGIEWAGIMVERVSRLSLEEYVQQNIFQPLGIKNSTFLPSEQMKANLAAMHSRDPDGTVRAHKDLFVPPQPVAQGNDPANNFYNAGGGLFGQIPEFCQILAALLNDGASLTNPAAQQRILSPATVTEAFTNQIPQWPDFGRQPVPGARPLDANPIPALWPQPPDQPQGWGLLGMLAPLRAGEGAGTGRGPMTTHWAGLPNLFWWCDREKQVAGMVAAQIVPFGDLPVLNLWHEIETSIYAGLEDSSLESRVGKLKV